LPARYALNSERSFDKALARVAELESENEQLLDLLQEVNSSAVSHNAGTYSEVQLSNNLLLEIKDVCKEELEK